MLNDLPIALRHNDMERNAYNAAFHDLGLRWHWDSDTYIDLLRRSPSPHAQIRHYLETRHPHLLKAYDAEFLARAIQDRAAHHRERACPSFDWRAIAAVRELGF